LSRWDPFAELTELRSRFDHLLEDFGAGGREWAPAIDMVRDDGHLVVRADVPGIKPEEIAIEVDQGVLVLSGKHEETTEETGKQFVRRERRFGAFSRRMALPEGVDPKKIKATTHDGVLEVTIPLPKEAAKEPITITPTAA
jgi:HSP20 family protein